jgi:dihydroorotate dehydrogenase (fumarate)
MDLSTSYLGLRLKNPIVASAGPLWKKIDQVRQAEDAGASAVVMYSLFEEQITHESRELDHYLNRGTETYAEALTYLPDMVYANLAPDAYLEQLGRIKKAVDIPIIGSLNGVSTGGWIEYAEKIERAGADALELNFYFLPTDPEVSGQDLENVYLQLVLDIRSRIKIPLALKLSPFFTSLPHLARRFTAAGADGLVLFNRFYQPDFDIEALEVVPSLTLSTSNDLRLPLHWIGILYGVVPIDLALTSGVHTAQDAIKGIMAGASVTMMTSELLAHGVGRISTILSDLKRWLEEHEYNSVTQMRGSMSQQAVAEPAVFERSNYVKVLNSFGRYSP